jgi:2-polyprenyl-6-hydroxyphenyl methylase/3-demethylubiquinone-9 3-methyltransferase
VAAVDRLYRDIWARTLATDGAVPERVAAAARLVPRGACVVDVGCGDGMLARVLGDGVRVIGVDFVDAAVRVARARGVRAVLADLNHADLPFRDGTIDVVTALDVVEHVIDPIAFVRGLHRILKAGGLAIVTTPNARFVRHVADLVLRGRSARTSSDPEGYDGGHLHYFTFRDLRALLEANGFVIDRESGIAPRDYRSLKVRAFTRVAWLWERAARTEFLSLGILTVARKT